MLEPNSDIKIKSMNKRAFFAFSLIALIAISMLTPLSLAQVGIAQPEKTVGFISVAPTVVGVGQSATVNLWLFPLPQNYLYAPYYEGYTGITVTFVKPDGSKDTFMPVDGTGQFDAGQSEATGRLYFAYEPDMAGNWSVSFTAPAQNMTDRTGTVLYTACTSSTDYFTVTTEPQNAGLLNGYPWSPLPNENTYWSYPINSNNREWSAISGEWLVWARDMANTFYGVTNRHWQPYGTAPNTAHIVWKQPTMSGGIIGGDYGSISNAPGSLSTNTRGAIVMAGKVFYNIPGIGRFQCVDLTTGKALYTQAGSLSGGIHLPGNPAIQSGMDSSVVLANSAGSTPTEYLYSVSGTTWTYYDPLTGTVMRTLSNCSSARMIDGTNLAYGVRSGTVFCWNLSRVVNNNWPTGIQWSVPYPTPLMNGSTSLGATPAVFAISPDLSTIVTSTYNQYWGYSATNGASLWNLTLNYPVMANEAIDLTGVDNFIVFDPTATSFHCYSIKTGAQLWESDSFADSQWASSYSIYSSLTSDYDNVYIAFPDGTMTALSLNNGETLWRSEATASTEYANNAVPFVIAGLTLVGGNLYAYAGYSIGYQLNPIPREAMLVCVNATTGDITWKLNGGIYSIAAASGYVLGSGMYDGNMYSIGKGPTETTVMASPKVSAQGSSVLIEGSVIDMSPASQDDASKVRFANGVPAVADEDMSEWMDYLHMQNATLLNNPPTPKGVTVRLSVVDPNNNCYEIGTATSDSSGLYKLTWTPEIKGEYTIYATFDGSESYWGSYTTTAVAITEAPATPSSAPIQTTTDYTLPIVGTGIAMILAVAIATLLILKKRP